MLKNAITEGEATHSRDVGHGRLACINQLLCMAEQNCNGISRAEPSRNDPKGLLTPTQNDIVRLRCKSKHLSVTPWRLAAAVLVDNSHWHRVLCCGQRCVLKGTSANGDDRTFGYARCRVIRAPVGRHDWFRLPVALILRPRCVGRARPVALRQKRSFADDHAPCAGHLPRVTPCVLPSSSNNGPGMMRNDLTIYDQVAEQWWSDDIRWVRTLKNLVPGRLKWFDRHIDWLGKDVLDLGCAGGFMSEAMAARGAVVTGIDPAAAAVDAARRHASMTGLPIRYEVGVGEALPYVDASFDAVVCVDVLEHVADLAKVLSEVARVLRPGGLFMFDTINRNPISRFATITIAEDLLRLLPRGTHDPAMFIKPAELRKAMQIAGLVPGPTTGLGPRGINRRFDLTFGPLPLTLVLFMGLAWKPEF